MYSYLGLGVAAECGLGIFYYQSTPLQKQIVMNDDSTHKVGLILVKTVVSRVPALPKTPVVCWPRLRLPTKSAGWWLRLALSTSSGIRCLRLTRSRTSGVWCLRLALSATSVRPVAPSSWRCAQLASRLLSAPGGPRGSAI